MILYDENYKFLGVSGQLLQKLGYEDMSDFSSHHRDFADLFEKENGLIYNFDNFSWIDFILYGGANKDKAVIKTKNNQKIDIQIDIQEIFLKDTINGVEKLFQIDLLGIDNTISTTEQTTLSHDKEINLNSFLDNDEKVVEIIPQNEQIIKQEEPKEEPIEEPLSINLSFLKEDGLAKNEDTKTTKELNSINLDFMDDTKDKKEEKKDDEIVLNFFKDSNFNNEPTPKVNEVEIKEEKAVETKQTPKVEDDKPLMNLNFLKKDEDEKEVDTKPKQEEKVSPPTINLGFLDTHKDEEKAVETKQTPKVEDDKPLMNLNFLKKDEDEKEVDTKPKQEEKVSPPTINLGFLKESDELTQTAQKKDTIINQIKNDIKEIDSSNQDNLKIKPSHDNDNNINNALKSMLNIGKTNETVIPQPKKDNTSEQNTPPLADLDIADLDKKEILKDFIEEASYNNNLIKEFINIDDYNSINYSIIKISSSAEILSLNSVNTVLLSLKEAINNKDTSKVHKEIEKLDITLNELKQYT